MKPRLSTLTLSVAVAAVCLAGAAASFSGLWGEKGELWQPGGRLPDFSYAGYHRGEKPLPVLERNSSSVSVREFGAKGDGETDDSDAFLKAVAAARHVVEIPPGRYRITQLIELNRSGIVLQGAGPDRTTLYFPKPLHDVRPNWGATTSGQKTSNYSWSGGFVTVRGDLGGEALTKIVGVARRGARRLRVVSTSRLRANQQVEIYQRDNDRNTLANHLYSGDAGDTSKLNGRTHASIVVTLQAI
ncbi:MAG: hypothetical protein GY953_32820, partial [bacterium]|nr:hypothetical protein [bacterium]